MDDGFVHAWFLLINKEGILPFVFVIIHLVLIPTVTFGFAKVSIGQHYVNLAIYK